MVIVDKLASQNNTTSFPIAALIRVNLRAVTIMSEGRLELTIADHRSVIRKYCIYYGRRHADEFRILEAQLGMELAHSGRDIDHRVVLGCTLIGGYGTGLPPGTEGYIECDDAGIIFICEPNATWVKAYVELIDVDIAGPGVERTGGGFIGGGFGAKSALEGMVIASALNQLTTRTRTNTVIGLTAIDSTMILHTAALAPDALRVHLSPVIGRIAAAKHAGGSNPMPRNGSVLQRLKELEELHEAGALTAEEHRSARARIVSDL